MKHIPIEKRPDGWATVEQERVLREERRCMTWGWEIGGYFQIDGEQMNEKEFKRAFGVPSDVAGPTVPADYVAVKTSNGNWKVLRAGPETDVLQAALNWRYAKPDSMKACVGLSSAVDKWVGDDLRPCRSPYCECPAGECSHPGCYDARDMPDEKTMNAMVKELNELTGNAFINDQGFIRRSAVKILRSVLAEQKK